MQRVFACMTVKPKTVLLSQLGDQSLYSFNVFITAILRQHLKKADSLSKLVIKRWGANCPLCVRRGQDSSGKLYPEHVEAVSADRAWRGWHLQAGQGTSRDLHTKNRTLSAPLTSFQAKEFSHRWLPMWHWSIHASSQISVLSHPDILFRRTWPSAADRPL